MTALSSGFWPDSLGQLVDRGEVRGAVQEGGNLSVNGHLFTHLSGVFVFHDSRTAFPNPIRILTQPAFLTTSGV